MALWKCSAYALADPAARPSVDALRYAGCKMQTSSIAGIFVGGRSTRMGGRPKGLLEIGGETIVARWRRIFDALGVPCVLVGANDAYASVGLEAIADAGDRGPVSGLAALCSTVICRGATHAIAVACDMPYVSEPLVRKLLDAPPAPIVAAHVDARWQPFFARYDARAALRVLDEVHELRSLQAVLGAACAVELPLTDDEKRELRDWDSPEDVTP